MVDDVPKKKRSPSQPQGGRNIAFMALQNLHHRYAAEKRFHSRLEWASQAKIARFDARAAEQAGQALQDKGLVVVDDISVGLTVT